ncbi:hypothetical protein LCGC14_2789510 [marine sediment metagenome]|uniref:Uncharacterized protein n=1 Tax=marine sediment metagenome TaxID=412755 RepID=A0A0F8YQW2_9ZZZZ
MKKQTSVIMDRKELHGCFLLASPPATNTTITQHKKPAVEFTIHPLGKVGTKYQYLVECDVPIRWDRLQSVYKQTQQQDIPLAERLLKAVE